MPDTYKTFLSPGSCKLEITDLVAAANDDSGVDLYGVAWEIEQVLIAGEGFAASPTDVWVNERGILNVGQSLFDKINRTANDNDNIPGQCTVIVKATSLVDSSKVARLKVLVGYPGEGGGGGGGGDNEFIAMLSDTDGFKPFTGTLSVGEEAISYTTETFFAGTENEFEAAVASVPVGSIVTYAPAQGGAAASENSMMSVFESEEAFLSGTDAPILTATVSDSVIVPADSFLAVMFDVTR